MILQFKNLENGSLANRKRRRSRQFRTSSSDHLQITDRSEQRGDGIFGRDTGNRDTSHYHEQVRQWAVEMVARSQVRASLRAIAGLSLFSISFDTAGSRSAKTASALRWTSSASSAATRCERQISRGRRSSAWEWTGSRLLHRPRKNSSRHSSEVICNFLNRRFVLETKLSHLSKVRLSRPVFFTIKDAAANQRVSPSALLIS